MFAKLQAAGPQDVAELLPHLEKRGDLLAEESILKLTERGRDEAEKMLAILHTQQKNIAETAKKNQQILLTDFLENEKPQLEADRIHWKRRLTELETELTREPARIRDVYDVKARRVEPVGLAYLWPSKG